MNLATLSRIQGNVLDMTTFDSCPDPESYLYQFNKFIHSLTSKNLNYILKHLKISGKQNVKKEEKVKLIYQTLSNNEMREDLIDDFINDGKFISTFKAPPFETISYINSNVSKYEQCFFNQFTY